MAHDVLYHVAMAAKKRERPTTASFIPTTPLIICISSLKGGGGKSALTSNLAVVFQRAGLRVAIIDADKKLRTSIQWSDDREEYATEHPDSGVKPIYTVKKTGRVAGVAHQTAEDYDIVIIDTGAQDSNELRAGLIAADLVITPVEPSNEALDTIADYMEIIADARDVRGDIPVLAVISRALHNSPQRIEEARSYLADYDLHVADAVLVNRVAYPDTKSEGLGVAEAKDEKAKSEIEALAAEIAKLTKES